MQKKGKIGKFERTLNANLNSILNSVKINSEELSSFDDADLALCKMELLIEREKCKNYWDTLIASNGGPSFSDFELMNPNSPEYEANRWTSIYTVFLNWNDEGMNKIVNFLESVGCDANTVFGIKQTDSEQIKLNKQIHAIKFTIPKMFECIENSYDIRSAKMALNNQLIALQSGNRTKSDLCIELFNATKK